MIRRWIAAFVLCAALLITAAGRAQQVTGKTLVLKAARLFDGKSNALVTPGVVVVSDGKIVATGPSASLPAGAEIIDLGDATLLPGFIDAHTHETAMNSNDFKQRELDGLQKTIAEQTLDATANVRVTLMAGFTTVRDVGSHDFRYAQRHPRRQSSRAAYDRFRLCHRRYRRTL
jgi:imidazolonepropionase-like amidohydrolase